MLAALKIVTTATLLSVVKIVTKNASSKPVTY